MVKILRWVCKKCDKRWIYPVDRCVYCKEKIEKQVGVKTEVVGVSQVFIPSPYHPIVPYYILILEDEHGNRMPKKTMKEYKIGDIYEDKASDDPHAVSIVKIKYDVYEALKESIELIGGIDVKANTKILIKPEIVAKAYPYMAMNTNPKVIDALIGLLIEKGVKKENIIVAEQSFFSAMEEILPRSEIDSICVKHGVGFADLSKKEFQNRTADKFRFEIAKELFENDIIINIPVMKTDMMLGISGALMNMTRVVSKNTFAELQKDPMKAAQAIGVLTKALPKYITIADATIGMQGNAPQYGEPAFFNMVIASRDPVALDKVFQEMCLLRKADYVELAGKLGVGEVNLDKIPVVGNELKAMQKEIKPAYGSKLIKK